MVHGNYFYIYLLLKKIGKRETIFAWWKNLVVFQKGNFFYFVLYFLKVEQIQKYNVINRLYKI
jgi:hypothetical protein